MAVRFEVDDAVAIITLDRPEALNALDVTLLKSLREYLITVRDDDAIHVAIVTDQGGKASCVGADSKSTLMSDATAQEICKSLDRSSLIGLFVPLLDLTDLDLCKPLIAAVNGHCLGGGLELALQCDIRIASSAATFALPEVRVGSIPAVSGLQGLLRAVTSAHAMQMTLTGDRMLSAPAALASGVVTDVCEPDELMPRALALARRIAENGPLAVQTIKRLARQSAHLSEIDARALTEMYWVSCEKLKIVPEGEKRSR